MSQTSLFEEPTPPPPDATVKHLAGQLGYFTAGERKLTPTQRGELVSIARDALTAARGVVDR